MQSDETSATLHPEGEGLLGDLLGDNWDRGPFWCTDAPVKALDATKGGVISKREERVDISNVLGD